MASKNQVVKLTNRGKWMKPIMIYGIGKETVKKHRRNVKAY